MCGILGYIGPYPMDSGAFRDVLALSRHRGPDHSAVHQVGDHRYGFNRLAIQDLSPVGNQPMVSSDGKQVLLFNGEVYNHMRLREKYGIRDCKGHGDTETLFHLFRKRGFEPSLPELDGMFAICWADYGTGRLHLARDMAGIKPLYYHAGDSIAFGSQLNQVMRLPGVGNDLVREHVADYFLLGCMIAPNTVFKGIHQLMPGETMEFDMDTRRRLHSKRYHVFERSRSADDRMESGMLEGLIEASVRDQLVADVPLASFMSGGIDSPVINAIARRQKPDIRAFTFRNRYDSTIDESPTANALSDIIGLSYTNIDYSHEDVKASIEEQFRYISEPLGDFSTIPTFFICRAARRSATVMLSGDGGDELFYGYRRHLDFLRDRSLFNLPLPLRSAYSRFRSFTGGPRVSNPIRYIRDIGSAYLDAQSAMRPQHVAFLLGDGGFSDALLETFSVDSGASAAQAPDVLTKADFYGYLQMVLRKVDLMSMGNSVEVRVPYLSKEVIGRSSLYEPRMRTAADLKKPLKEIFGKCYPNGRTLNRKTGFTLPLAKLLQGPLREDVLEKSVHRTVFGAGLIDPAAVASFVQDYYDGKHAHHQAVWHIYAWQKWASNNQLT